MTGSTASDVTLYNAAADDWWSGDRPWLRTLANLVPARLRHFDRVVGSWSGLAVLDLGCGGGFMAEALAARGARVSGLDPAEQAIAAARRHAEHSGHAIDYRVGHGESLPWPDGCFDAVVCVDVLEHVADLERVLAEIARVLRPQGWFLFDTINRTAFARLMVVTMGERVLGLLPRGTHDPALFISPRELNAKLSGLGFQVGRMQGLGPTGLTRRGDFRFGLVPLTAALYIGSARLGGPVAKVPSP